MVALLVFILFIVFIRRIRVTLKYSNSLRSFSLNSVFVSRQARNMRVGNYWVYVSCTLFVSFYFYGRLTQVAWTLTWVDVNQKTSLVPLTSSMSLRCMNEYYVQYNFGKLPAFCAAFACLIVSWWLRVRCLSLVSQWWQLRDSAFSGHYFDGIELPIMSKAVYLLWYCLRSMRQWIVRISVGMLRKDQSANFMSA